MDKNKQIAIIAQKCGKDNLFLIKKGGFYYRENAYGYTDRISEAWIVDKETAGKHEYPHYEPVTVHPAPLPNYPGSLDAIKGAEDFLLGDVFSHESCLFAHYLCSILGHTQFWRATAAQRAEALLKTFNLWEYTN